MKTEIDKIKKEILDNSKRTLNIIKHYDEDLSRLIVDSIDLCFFRYGVIGLTNEQIELITKINNKIK